MICPWCGKEIPDQDETGELPSEEEVCKRASMLNVPVEYALHYHARKEENRTWFNVYGKLINWPREMLRLWNQARSTWWSTRKQSSKPSVWETTKKLELVEAELKALRDSFSQTATGAIVPEHVKPRLRELKAMQEQLKRDLLNQS